MEGDGIIRPKRAGSAIMVQFRSGQSMTLLMKAKPYELKADIQQQEKTENWNGEVCLNPWNPDYEAEEVITIKKWDEVLFWAVATPTEKQILEATRALPAATRRQ